MEAKRSYEFGTFRLDPAERRLLRDDQPVALTPKCFDLLVVLVENSGHLLEKDELLKRLWPDQFVEEANLSFNVSSLRKALGEGQNGQRFIETVPKKGFRFVARVEERRDDRTSLTIEAPEETAEGTGVGKPMLPAHSMASARLPLSLKILGGILIAGALAFLAYGLWVRRATTLVQQKPSETIAVLPFKPLSTESRDESLEMGMAETLITKLSTIRHVVVRPMTAVRKYTDPSQDPVKAGRELQAEVVLDGSIQKAGDRIRVTVRLTNVQSGATLWAGQFDENFTDIFKVQDSIAERVTKALTLRLSGEEEKQLAKHYTDNPEAYQLYLQGDYLRDKRDYNQSLEFYQRTIEKDPNFALAYIGLAESYMHLTAEGAPKIPVPEALPKVRAALTKALQLDETLAEAHNALAEVAYQFDYDWSGAEKEFKRAVELNPNVAHIRLAYGWYLMTAGRSDEAMSQMKSAQALDPRNLIIQIAIGRLSYSMREYDRALERYQKIVEIEPNYLRARSFIVDVYEQKGMYAEALQYYLEGQIRNGILKPEEVERFKETFTESGWRGCLQTWLAWAEEKSKKEHVSPTFLATLCARLGDKDRAFALLEKAVDERDPFVIELKIEPKYDNLRSDPRYIKLLERMNLTP